MANTVFGASTDKPTVLKAGKATLTIDNKPLIALNVQVTFQRSVEKLPVIGESKVISIGDAQGTFTCDTVLANSMDAFKAFKLTGDDCEPFSMKIKLNDSSCDLNGQTVTAHNCFASMVSLSAQGGRGFIGEGVQVTFTALTIGDGTAAA